MPAAAHPMIFPIIPKRSPRNTVRILPPYKAAIQGRQPLSHTEIARLVDPISERTANNANAPAQATQNRSAKNTVPVLSDSFVTHSSMVFIKSGRTPRAATAPNIHFADALAYVVLTYFFIFSTGISSDHIFT